MSLMCPCCHSPNVVTIWWEWECIVNIYYSFTSSSNFFVTTIWFNYNTYTPTVSSHLSVCLAHHLCLMPEQNHEILKLNSNNWGSNSLHMQFLGGNCEYGLIFKVLTLLPSALHLAGESALSKNVDKARTSSSAYSKGAFERLPN